MRLQRVGTSEHMHTHTHTHIVSIYKCDLILFLMRSSRNSNWFGISGNYILHLSFRKHLNQGVNSSDEIFITNIMKRSGLFVNWLGKEKKKNLWFLVLCSILNRLLLLGISQDLVSTDTALISVMTAPSTSWKCPWKKDQEWLRERTQGLNNNSLLSANRISHTFHECLLFKSLQLGEVFHSWLPKELSKS